MAAQILKLIPSYDASISLSCDLKDFRPLPPTSFKQDPIIKNNISEKQYSLVV